MPHLVCASFSHSPHPLIINLSLVFYQVSPVHHVVRSFSLVMTAAVFLYHGNVIENQTVKMAQMKRMPVVIDKLLLRYIILSFSLAINFTNGIRINIYKLCYS